METLKNEIKILSKRQTILRDQRKTVYNKLERIIDSSKASYEHYENGITLRKLYAAYGILKGKSLDEVKLNYGTTNIYYLHFDFIKKEIDELVELHSNEFINENIKVKNEEIVRTCE